MPLAIVIERGVDIFHWTASVSTNVKSWLALFAHTYFRLTAFAVDEYSDVVVQRCSLSTFDTNKTNSWEPESSLRCLLDSTFSI